PLGPGGCGGRGGGTRHRLGCGPEGAERDPPGERPSRTGGFVGGGRYALPVLGSEGGRAVPGFRRGLSRPLAPVGGGAGGGCRPYRTLPGVREAQGGALRRRGGAAPIPDSPGPSPWTRRPLAGWRGTPERDARR